MSGIVAIPNKPDWSVGMRWFEALFTTAESTVDNPDDQYALRQAVAFQWLDVGSKSEPQRTRLARALLGAAAQLEAELRTPPVEFARDISAADQLVVLAADLQDWLDGASAEDQSGPT